MSETENPAATLTRLLKMNLRVVKDSGALANVNVATEYPNADAFKGFDGQVTVGLAETSDQKLELSGKTRKRTSALRVNVWTTEQPNATESARVMRSKIVEEINRVIRQNRSSPNQTLYNFYNAGPITMTQKAYRGVSEASPHDLGWVELSGQEYQQLWSSDDDRYQASANLEGEYSTLLFGFKPESRKKTAQKIVLTFEGYGTAPNGNGVIVKAWNNGSSAWENAQSGSAGGSDETVAVTLLQNLPNFADDEGYVWFLARTAGASDGATPAVIHCDYVGCTVTVHGISYCDLVSYRDADRVDVKPFVFRTEFNVKSWFFENIGV